MLASVVGRVSGRRRWTGEQKLTVLRDAFGPEGCMRTTCERLDVGSGSIGIGLPSGIRVTVDATVDADALSRVIGILTR